MQRTKTLNINDAQPGRTWKIWEKRAFNWHTQWENFRSTFSKVFIFPSQNAWVSFFFSSFFTILFLFSALNFAFLDEQEFFADKKKDFRRRFFVSENFGKRGCCVFAASAMTSLHGKDRVASIPEALGIFTQCWQKCRCSEVGLACLRLWLGEVIAQRRALEWLRLTDGHGKALAFGR